MRWCNIPTEVMGNPTFIGCEPIARATWLCVLLRCVEQENSGRVSGALTWSDRRWQQWAGVTAAEVKAAAPLLVFEGDDLIVQFYPHDQQAAVAVRRRNARINGVHGGRPTTEEKERNRNRKDIGPDTGTNPGPDVGANVGYRAATAAPASDDQFLAELQQNTAYRELSVAAEFAKMRVWCSANRKQPTRRRFINWLNRCDAPMRAGKHGGHFR